MAHASQAIPIFVGNIFINVKKMARVTQFRWKVI
jgi:hypothetical protein